MKKSRYSGLSAAERPVFESGHESTAFVAQFAVLCAMNRSSMAAWWRQPLWYLCLGWALVYLRGLWLDVMDVDASQYASISMEMLQNGHWLEVQHRGADYLDKPPLLFWLSAGAFRLLGYSNWAYKLPSFLFALAGIAATYRFARLFYPERTARWAAMVLGSSIGLLLLCNDVRTDTLLLGTSACAVWQLAAYQQSRRWAPLWAAFFFIGLAMLAKGPIGLVMPALALGSHLLLQRDFRSIFSWKWLPALGLTALVLAPMCWGLYQQYDVHPEKMVNGRSGVSGLYFFFWEQSFGRITGENVWQNDTSGLFFVHTYLWAFLPWSLLLAAALFTRLGQLLRSGFRLGAAEEAYALGGFLLTFIALSFSRYKLPHYVFITLPWASVLTAAYLARLRDHALRVWWPIQHILLTLLLILALTLVFFVFPENNLLNGGLCISGAGVWAWMCWRQKNTPTAEHLILHSFFAALLVAFVLNFHFYPRLLPWQSTSQAALAAREAGIPAEKLYFFQRHGHALDFYNRRITKGLPDAAAAKNTLAQEGPFWVYTTAAGKNTLEAAGLRTEIVAECPHFQVALLKLAFLNPATRKQSSETVFLLRIF